MSGACSSGLAFAVLACLCGCVSEEEYLPHVHNGDADRGKAALARFECGVCHEIRGVPGASGQVGPPLRSFARHPYIAGKLPNEPELLVRWIADAPSLAPHTAMPAIAMREQDARDMAAYLYEHE
jgi:cytochrome c